MTGDRDDLGRAALVVIDVERGFDEPAWGRRDNPACEANVGRLIGAWRERGGPVVFVRHLSDTPGSPLTGEGAEFKDEVTGEPDLLVTKSVHSAFYGRPDLHAWLQEREVGTVAVCGITTDHCCETTARMAGDLGYRVLFVRDATHTFDRVAPDGTVVPAEQVSLATAASLHGEFAEVVATDDLAPRPAAV
ncbi:MAG TPA: cysteine hydrolase family protein [Acidimicrobiales bacterium]|jgi:nicotinamidase-related amidase